MLDWYRFNSAALGRTYLHLDSISSDWRVATCPHTHTPRSWRHGATVKKHFGASKPQIVTRSINYYSDRWLTGRLFFSMALFILTFRALDLGFHGHFFQLSNSFVNAIYRLFPYISSSVYCLLVAVCYDQILIEVTSRAKSPNISIFNV